MGPSGLSSESVRGGGTEEVRFGYGTAIREGIAGFERDANVHGQVCRKDALFVGAMQMARLANRLLMSLSDVWQMPGRFRNPPCLAVR